MKTVEVTAIENSLTITHTFKTAKGIGIQINNETEFQMEYDKLTGELLIIKTNYTAESSNRAIQIKPCTHNVIRIK